MSTQDERALHLATQSGWYRFERKRDNWVPVQRALTYWSATSLAVDPLEPQWIYVGTERSGLFVSENGGISWKRASPNVPQLMIASLLALPGEVLLVGTVPAALYRLRRGEHWEELEDVRHKASGGNFPPNPALGARTRHLAIEAANGRLYAGIEVGGLLISNDAGATWEAGNDGLTDPDLHQLLPCARTANLVLAACGEGVFRSLDRGVHWEEVTPSGARIYATSLTEDQNGMIYLGVACGRPNTWLRPERADAAIFRSPNGGKNWEPVIEGLKGGVMDFCAFPDRSAILAGTSEGELLAIDKSGCRVIAAGLPCIHGLAWGD